MQSDVQVLRESCIVIGNPSVTDPEFNPLISMSDQNRPSPYNIITLSSRKVMRIRKTINQGFVDPITLARDCKNKTVFHRKAQTLACKRKEREKNPAWLELSARLALTFAWKQNKSSYRSSPEAALIQAGSAGRLVHFFHLNGHRPWRSSLIKVTCTRRGRDIHWGGRRRHRVLESSFFPDTRCYHNERKQ